MFLKNQNITSNAWYYQAFYLIKMKHRLAKINLLKLSFFIPPTTITLGYKNSILFSLCYATIAPLVAIFCALLLCGRFTVQAAEEASIQTITLEDGTTANILVYLYDNSTVCCIVCINKVSQISFLH